MHLLKIKESIPKDNIQLTSPIPIQGGSFFSKLLCDGKPTYIQFPECQMKQGVVSTQRGKYCDLLYERLSSERFLDWIEKLETIILDKIKDKKKDWFDMDISDDDLETMTTPITRSYKSGKNILIRTQFIVVKDKIKCMIYNEEQSVLSIDSLDENSNIVPLVYLEGIKFSARSFEICVKLSQIMVFVDKINLENTFLIEGIKHPIKDVDNIENKDVSIDRDTSQTENIAEEEHLDIEPIIDVEESGKDSVPIKPLEQVEEDKDEDKNDVLEVIQDKFKENEEEDLHEEQREVNGDKESGDKGDNELREDNLEEKNDNLEEVELDVNDLEDEIRLKSQDDIYFEIYRDARRKAKGLRQEAIEAYLEANAIKNKYLLDEIDSSTEEVEDEDEDEDEEHEDREYNEII